ncbi:uncharacterized protein LOC122897647 isoform X3 [Neovison vison]|uniref:uncharacterized protein LOC122897647 isoform X3 n=1 Tax=Neovison vison TaxID=452646 RepID=UPI001CF08110|nr:uncharacterized protein LOC122897647 isoform X3 [Neogale vison]
MQSTLVKLPMPLKKMCVLPLLWERFRTCHLHPEISMLALTCIWELECRKASHHSLPKQDALLFLNCPSNTFHAEHLLSLWKSEILVRAYAESTYVTSPQNRPPDTVLVMYELPCRQDFVCDIMICGWKHKQHDSTGKGHLEACTGFLQMLLGSVPCALCDYTSCVCSLTSRTLPQPGRLSGQPLLPDQSALCPNLCLRPAKNQVHTDTSAVCIEDK